MTTLKLQEIIHMWFLQKAKDISEEEILKRFQYTKYLKKKKAEKNP